MVSLARLWSASTDESDNGPEPRSDRVTRTARSCFTNQRPLDSLTTASETGLICRRLSLSERPRGRPGRTHGRTWRLSRAAARPRPAAPDHEDWTRRRQRGRDLGRPSSSGPLMAERQKSGKDATELVMLDRGSSNASAAFGGGAASGTRRGAESAKEIALWHSLRDRSARCSRPRRCGRRSRPCRDLVSRACVTRRRRARAVARCRRRASARRSWRSAARRG
jgi:hypothetical protein